jgi:hypothetical protein
MDQAIEVGIQFDAGGAGAGGAGAGGAGAPMFF